MGGRGGGGERERGEIDGRNERVVQNMLGYKILVTAGEHILSQVRDH